MRVWARRIPLEVYGMKRRTAFAGERVGSGGERRRELAGGEGVEGAEAAIKFDRGQTPLAVEPAKNILGGALPLF